MIQRRTDNLAAAASAVTAALVGSSFVVTRFVIGEIDPLSLALLRYVVCLVLLLPAVSLARPTFAWRDLLPIGALGISQFALPILLINYALAVDSAARVAVIFASIPLLSLVLGAALGREKLTVAKSSGVLLTVLGVAFALEVPIVETVGSPQRSIADLAAFGSAVLIAASSVLYGPYLEKYPLVTVGSVAILCAIVFLAALAAGNGLLAGLLRHTAVGWLAILALGGASAIGYVLWLWALARASPARVTAFLALSPLTAACLAALLLGESLRPSVLTGIGSVAAGLWLMTVRRSHDRQALSGFREVQNRRP